MAKKNEKADESQGRIAWDTAEVKDSRLVVELDGEVSAKWSKRVVAIVERLARSDDAAAVKVTREKIEVSGVTQGGERDLRHLLEGAVQQANADFAPKPEEAGGVASSEDTEMTAAFRAFAD
jgi:hypothetical protein